MSAPPRFITVEGGEGAGKSTQVRHLVDWLGRCGIPAIATREPGGAPGAEAIRDILLRHDNAGWDALTEALLHNAARRNHLELTVKPALETGRWVVCDRFADSTLAYQGYGMGLALETLRALHQTATGGIRPDLTILLDLPATEGLKRAAGRREGVADAYEGRDLSFHERLRSGFQQLAGQDPERFFVVDALNAEDKVRADIQHFVEARYGVPEPRNTASPPSDPGPPED